MDALSEARATLEKLARDPKAKMFGLSDPLRCLARVLDEQHAENVTLARAILRLHYWPGTPLKADQFEAIVKIAGTE